MERKWYLAGPICFVTDGSDRGWREEAKRRLACIDPFEQEKIGGLDHGGESPKERFNRLRLDGAIAQVREEMQEILRIDLEAVLRCFGVLAYSPEPTWGTIRECCLAHLLGKPVVLWVGNMAPYDLANTLIGVSTVVAGSFENAVVLCDELERWDELFGGFRIPTEKAMRSTPWYGLNRDVAAMRVMEDDVGVGDGGGLA